MTGPVKCTYKECFQLFRNVEAMIKHKDKDPEHFYCKKCDVDSADDMTFMIHQIESSKHICCPICGQEFRSPGGRDEHVDRNHRKTQMLQCIGCEANLAGASAYMAHIEKGECEVITLELYHRQRAEKQIQKDAWDAALNSNGGVFLSSAMVSAATNSEVPILDDHAHTSTGWNDSNSGCGVPPLRPITNTTSRTTAGLPGRQGRLLLDTYPPLQSQRQPEGKGKQPVRDDSSDLMSFNDLEERTRIQTTSFSSQSENERPGPWNTNDNVERLFNPCRKNSTQPEKLFPSITDMSGALAAENQSILTAATDGNETWAERTSDGRNKSTSINQSEVSSAWNPADYPKLIPGAAQAINQDPNAQWSTIQTAPSILIPSFVDPQTFWDDILKQFFCPGYDCRRGFDTAEDFRAHLTTGAHVGGRTQCPSCLSKFQSTAALVAHCQSASRKCNIRKTTNYNQIMRELTGGLIGTAGHLKDGNVRYVANKVEDW